MASDGDQLLEYLADRDAPCPRCGYNLRGLSSPHCPECGDALVLRVGLVEPRMGAYVLAVVACSLGFGGTMLFTTLAAFWAPGMWWRGVSPRIMLATLLITGLALGGLVVWRRRFRRHPTGAQWLVAGTALFLVVVSFAMIVITFDT